MHHLIFAPAGGDNTRPSLTALGLPEHEAESFHQAVQIGPGEQFGFMYHWKNVPPVYNPDRQLWIPATPAGSLKAERYWIGIETSRMPEPHDLRRPGAIVADAVQLGDGNGWGIPSIEMVPYVFQVTQGGEDILMPRQEFANFVAEVQTIASGIKGFELQVRNSDLLRIGRMALCMNYRMPKELASHMGLWDTQNLVQAFSIAAGLSKPKEVSRG